MRRGAVSDAISQIEQWYKEEAGTSEAMELGACYLWLKDYSAAWHHFSEFNATYPQFASTTYAMAGVAQWCLNTPHEAVRQWHEGLQCGYADAAGGAQLPLLLFFASIVEPEIFPRTEAERLLAERADDPRAHYWPGPLTAFILRRISEEELRAQCYDERYDDETTLRHWMTDFYCGVLALADGNREQFQHAMQKTGAMSWEDFDASEDLFLSKLWSEEFFLARHEASKE